MPTTTRYIIVSTDEADTDTIYWSNKVGWTTYENADIFTESEKNSLGLPLSGKWAEIEVTSTWGPDDEFMANMEYIRKGMWT